MAARGVVTASAIRPDTVTHLEPDMETESREAARHAAMFDAAAAHAHPFPADRFAGRGIVICGGGDVYFPCAWVCIGMLRRLGCTLPIELWYRGPNEMTAAMLDLMLGCDVVCVDAYAVAAREPMLRLDSWELKPFAIVHSRFAEVLYLDADNMPVRDPAALFDAPGYAATGAVFWPDRHTGTNDAQPWLKRSAWDICGVPFRIEPEIESGQLLIDKRRSWHPLMLTLHLNAHSDFHYAHFYGDKDTFRLAWHRAGAAFTLMPHPVRNLGASEVIVQHDFDGTVLFQHRNGDKWQPGRTPRRIRGFQGQAACTALLRDLEGRWRPPVRRLPADFTPVERAAYDAIHTTRWFVYRLEGATERVLELRGDLTIGYGRQTMEMAWGLEADKDGQPVLALRNAQAPTCFLRRGPDGVWRGRWRVYDRGRVALGPGEAPEGEPEARVSLWRRLRDRYLARV